MRGTSPAGGPCGLFLLPQTALRFKLAPSRHTTMHVPPLPAAHLAYLSEDVPYGARGPDWTLRHPCSFRPRRLQAAGLRSPGRQSLRREISCPPYTVKPSGNFRQGQPPLCRCTRGHAQGAGSLCRSRPLPASATPLFWQGRIFRLHPMPCQAIRPPRAEVVELVDTLGSGSSSRKGVGVRVSPSAPPKKAEGLQLLAILFLFCFTTTLRRFQQEPVIQLAQNTT